MPAKRTQLTDFEFRVLTLAVERTAFVQLFSACDSCKTYEGSVFVDGQAGEIELEVQPEDSDPKIVEAIEAGLCSLAESAAEGDFDDRHEHQQLGY